MLLTPVVYKIVECNHITSIYNLMIIVILKYTSKNKENTVVQIPDLFNSIYKIINLFDYQTQNTGVLKLYKIKIKKGVV